MGKKQVQNKKQQPQGHFQVFVSGLPYQCTEENLKEFFSSENEIVIKLPKYQDTGRCLGYGHVEFQTQEEYTQALAKNADHIGTRYVNVQPAKGKKAIEPQIKNIPVGCKCLFVKNLPYQTTQQQLSKQFSSCGIVKDVRMIKNWQTKQFKGFAYVDYRDTGSVKKAITKYHGKKFKGRDLICDAVTTNMKKGFKRFDNPQQENVDAENDQQMEEQSENEQ